MAATVSREILVPFQIGQDGGIAYTIDPIVQATQHVLAAVATGVGERAMRSDYGTNVYTSLFGMDDPLFQADVRSAMQLAVQKWVPEVSLVSIDLTGTDIAAGALQFNISFRLVGSAVIQTASIAVGGTVTETTTPVVQE